MSKHLTRRGMVWLACIVVLAVGCSGADPDPVAPAAAGTGEEEPAAAGTGEDNPTAAATGGGEGATVACEVGQTDGDLVLYNWTEYIDPELVDQFSSQFDVRVIEDFYPSNEEMLAKVQGGASGYDVVVPSDYMVGIMIDQGLLARLDRNAIPNVENVAKDFQSPPFDPELAYSMPYQWGTTGIGVNTEVLGDVEPTWGLIFDPEMTQDYAGRISMLDDPREAMAAALSYLGHDINTTDEAQLREAADLIAGTRQRLAAFDSDQYEDLLVSGETVVAHGYSGDFFAAYDANDAYDTHTYLIPEEGAVRWVDNMAVLADAPHPCTAHTFINFLLNAENGAALTNWNFYASPNAAAEEFIDAEVLEDPAIYPPSDVLANLEFLRDTGDAEILYNDLFTEAKS